MRWQSFSSFPLLDCLSRPTSLGPTEYMFLRQLLYLSATELLRIPSQR